MESFAVLLTCILATMAYKVYAQDDDGPLSPPYTFVSEPKEINVLEGEDAQIVCSITGLFPGLPLLWLNQSFVFGMDDNLFTDESRASLEKTTSGDTKTFTLSISRSQLVDEGEYECQVPGRFKLRQKHNLFVNIPPEITSDPNAPSQFDLKLGDNLSLECPATGKPDPVVTWYRADNKPIQGNSSVEGERMMLSNVTEHENGGYICIASNGFGSDETRAFSVNVEFEPRVETPSKMVHTGPGHSVRLECTFSGNPSVQTIWQYQGKDINPNQYRIAMTTNKADDRMHTWISTLDIEDLKEDQLGEYTCLGSNILGAASESITLSAMPHSLIITSDSKGMYSDQYKLEWQFSSKPEPIECFVTISQLNLTEDGLYRFIPMGNTTVPAVQNNSEVHPQEFIIDGLQENMTYTAKLQCRNEHGQTDPTDEFEFSTSEDVNLAPPPIQEEEEDVATILSTLPKNKDEDDEDEDDVEEDNAIGEVKYEEPKEGASHGRGSTTTPAAALLLTTSAIWLMR